MNYFVVILINKSVYLPQDSAGLSVTDIVTARAKLKEIRGFLVEKPIDFLEQQNLWPGKGTNEYLVPTKVYT